MLESDGGRGLTSLVDSDFEPLCVLQQGGVQRNP